MLIFHVILLTHNYETNIASGGTTKSLRHGPSIVFLLFRFSLKCPSEASVDGMVAEAF